MYVPSPAISPLAETIRHPTSGFGLTSPMPRAASSSERPVSSMSRSAFILVEKPVNIAFRVEHHQVIDLLADTDVADRQVQFLCDSDSDAALGCAVEFGEDNSRDVGGFHELTCLF